MAQAELAQSKAAMAETEATLAEAAANAQRARELQASGALSAQQINQYLTAERTAQARLEAQRALFKTQQLRLAQTQVLAPDNGVISARNATVGAVVPAGMELFRLIRQGRLEWRAEVVANELTGMGAIVDEAIAYRTVPEKDDNLEAIARVKEEGADMVTFTSGSTVEHFLVFDKMLSSNEVQAVDFASRIWGNVTDIVVMSPQMAVTNSG